MQGRKKFGRACTKRSNGPAAAARGGLFREKRIDLCGRPGQRGDEGTKGVEGRGGGGLTDFHISHRARTARASATRRGRARTREGAGNVPGGRMSGARRGRFIIGAPR